MLKCENCGKEHDGSYGSGRFCSVKCSRGFSTKDKRKEINEKVSKKLYKQPEKKICPICGNDFYTKRYTTFCSNVCRGGLPKKKGEERKKGSGGLRPGGGKSKQIPYTNWMGFKMSLNKEEIEVAKVLDENKLNWNRNTKGFPYTTREGKQRNYYPDFVVDETKYYEYKGWITEEMTHKMEDAKIKNNLDLTIIVGGDKRYKDFGITLDELKNEKNNN